ncbi:hypothetical protein HU200_009360 [Digitaria exilis]|uniref:Cytochrome P450 n=1 Tax=Digitaria exilis TaxID=1010633 RepID=A0A835FM42_9POAL|nr:hypothetical protein HU200_009360 [Digitaria exilis]
MGAQGDHHRYYSTVPSATIAGGLALLALCSYYLLVVVVRRGDKKAKSKRYAPVVGTVFHQMYHVRRLHDYHTDLFREHKTFQLLAPAGRRQIYTCDPAVVEHILRTNFANYGKGPFNYENMTDLLGDGIFAVDGEKWRQQRKIASYDFSTRALRDFSGARLQEERRQARRRRGRPRGVGSAHGLPGPRAQGHHGLHLHHRLRPRPRHAGRRLVGRRQPLRRGVRRRQRVHAAPLRERLLEGHEAPQRRLRGRAQGPGQGRRRVRVQAHPRQGSGALWQQGTGRPSIGFEAGHAVQIHRNGHERIRDGGLQVPEGHHTEHSHRRQGHDGGIARVVPLHGVQAPQVQEKVRQEAIKATDASETATVEEFAQSLTDEALNKMHYLHAALTETLRLYPSVPLDNKQCFGDDVLPDGSSVSKGDIVFYVPYAMGRMEYLWGDDAEVFRPERWLDDCGEFQQQSPFKFTAFQAGPRICLGKEFAYRQMKIFAAVLLRSFVFRLRDGVGATVNYRTMITLHVDQGLHLTAHAEVDDRAGARLAGAHVAACSWCLQLRDRRVVVLVYMRGKRAVIVCATTRVRRVDQSRSGWE